MLSSPKSCRSAVTVGLQICAAYTIVLHLSGFTAASLELGRVGTGASAPSPTGGSCGPGYSCLAKAAGAGRTPTASGSHGRTIRVKAAHSSTPSASPPAGRVHGWKHSSGPGHVRPCAGNKAVKKSGLSGAPVPSTYLVTSKARSGVHHANRVAGRSRSGTSHRKLSGSAGGSLVFDYSATLPANSGLLADQTDAQHSPAYPGYPEQMRATSSHASSSGSHVAVGNHTAGAPADTASAAASSTGVGGESDRVPVSNSTHCQDSSSASAESAGSQSDTSPEDDDKDFDED